jgi:predicted RNase H-like nuclease (RuvC/YqgF family)
MNTQDKQKMKQLQKELIKAQQKVDELQNKLNEFFCNAL